MCENSGESLISTAPRLRSGKEQRPGRGTKSSGFGVPGQAAPRGGEEDIDFLALRRRIGGADEHPRLGLGICLKVIHRVQT